jgi:cell division protein FtsL
VGGDGGIGLDGQTLIAIVTAITSTVVTIAGLILKDRQDARRWQRESQTNAARHLENASKLATNAAKLDDIQVEVNGKMDRVVSIAHQAGIALGEAKASQGEGAK